MAGNLTAMIAAAFSGSAAPPVTSDPYFEYTTLLLPGNGTNGAQNNTFLDSSTNNFTITRNGNTTQGTFSPFSQTGWGNYFNGSSSLNASNAGFNPSGAFTVEFWFYPIDNTTFYQGLISTWPDGLVPAQGMFITKDGATCSIQLAANGSSVGIASFTWATYLNQWNHIAFVRNSSDSCAVFLNGGRLAAPVTKSGSPGQTSLTIGRYFPNNANYYFTGYMSNVRFLNGSNAYDPASLTITVPTTPFATNTTNQVLLTCQANRFIDSNTATTANTITVNGSPSVQAFSPFNPSASWSAATYGGSGYFDGNGDWLTIAEAPALQLNSTAFSIELWLYPSSVSASRMIIGKRDTSGGSGYAFSWYIQGNSFGGFIFYSANGSLTSNNNVLIANAWNHIAVTSDGTNVSMYANGSRVNTPTALIVGNSASSVYIGNFPVDNLYYQGNLADIRIQKGVQTYTGTTYTVPTAPLTRDANTSLLLNYTNAGIYDATSKNDLETVDGAQISTAQSKFGGSSMAFDGTGDWLTNNNASNSLLAFGTGDFTIEGWFYSNNASSAAQRGMFQTSDTIGGLKPNYTTGVPAPTVDKSAMPPA